jgi:hypothetical protein
MHWLTGQCSWTTTLGHIEPEVQHFLQQEAVQTIPWPKGSKIANLRSIYHPERREYDLAKMRFKTGAGKT